MHIAAIFTKAWPCIGVGRGDYTIFSENLIFFSPCHNFFPLSSVQINIIPACCLLCVL